MRQTRRKAPTRRRWLGTSGADDRSAAEQPGRLSDAGVVHVAWEPRGRYVLVVAVLRHSRALWAELVQEPTPLWIGKALLDGARYFGGCPRQWWLEYPDCWLARDCGGRWQFSSPLPELARHLSTELGVWRPRGPGLAEAALHYLAWHFVMKGGERSEENRALRAFLDRTAQRRPHPRQPDRSVAEVLAEEREQLRPLPETLEMLETVLLGRCRGADAH